MDDARLIRAVFIGDLTHTPPPWKLSTPPGKV